jgi:hypothetical protein
LTEHLLHFLRASGLRASGMLRQPFPERSSASGLWWSIPLPIPTATNGSNALPQLQANELASKCAGCQDAWPSWNCRHRFLPEANLFCPSWEHTLEVKLVDFSCCRCAYSLDVHNAGKDLSVTAFLTISRNTGLVLKTNFCCVGLTST